MDTLKIDAHIITWNEEKFILHTLNYYSQFCRSITIHDNNSTDDTFNIIQKFHCGGVDIFVKWFDTGNKIDEREYLNVKNNCWKGSDADFVIVCDADELLFSDSFITPIASLQEHKKNNSVFPFVKGIEMFSEEYPGNYTKPLLSQVCHGKTEPAFNKQIIFDPKQVEEINYRPGAHSCYPVLKKEYHEKFQPYKKNALALLHFKYLSREHVKQRHKLYASRLSDYNKQNEFGKEYLFEQQVDEKFDFLKRHRNWMVQVKN